MFYKYALKRYMYLCTSSHFAKNLGKHLTTFRVFSLVLLNRENQLSQNMESISEIDICSKYKMQKLYVH